MSPAQDSAPNAEEPPAKKIKKKGYGDDCYKLR